MALKITTEANFILREQKSGDFFVGVGAGAGRSDIQ